jgi:hypothetical protein
MATPVAYPSQRSFIGLTKEVTQGTAVPPLVATVPVAKFKPKPKFELLKDQSQRGSMAGTYGQTQGAGHEEWEIEESPAYYDTLPYFLQNILGEIATTGAGPFTHNQNLLNSGTAQPGTFTIFDWQGTPANQGRQYPGCVVTELTIKGNPESEFITWSAKGLSWISAVTAAAPVAAPTTDAPMAAWRTNILFDDVADLTFGEWEVTIARTAEAEHTSQNSQQPFLIFRGELVVTGSLRQIKPATEAQFLKFMNNTGFELEINADNGGLTTAQRKITLHMQVCNFDDGAALSRDEIAIGYTLPFEAMGNTTDAGASGGYSPIKTTVINNTAAATYS